MNSVASGEEVLSFLFFGREIEHGVFCFSLANMSAISPTSLWGNECQRSWSSTTSFSTIVCFRLASSFVSHVSGLETMFSLNCVTRSNYSTAVIPERHKHLRTCMHHLTNVLLRNGDNLKHLPCDL